MRFITRFLWEEDGPTAVEYAVLLALILMAVMGGIGAVGSQTGGMWLDINDRTEAEGLGS